MFITQGIRKGNEFWKYIVGSVAVIAASLIGQIPFSIAALAVVMQRGADFTDPNVLMTALEPNLSLFLILFSFIPAIVALYFVVRYLHKQTWKSVTTGREKVDWRRVFLSFGLWAAINVVAMLVSYWSAPENFVINFQPAKFAILVLIGIVMLPIQTSTEEYIFRGYLMQGFAALARNRWFPLVMTSGIFGIMHLANPEVGKVGYTMLVYYIGTGFFLGILTLMDDGLELALGFHAANNLTAALLVTTDWTALQTHSILKEVSEPNPTRDIVLPVIIIYPILLFVFGKIYKWSDWREKLTGKLTLQRNLQGEENEHRL